MSTESVASAPLHPFEPFPGTDATMFIQWKGTDVCMDFWCPCGGDGHVCEYSAHYVKCPACGAVYQLGTQVKAMRVPPEDVPKWFVTAKADDD